MAMITLLAGIGGALIGLMGVATGTLLQSRKDHQRWLRDQKLRAAIDFIGATGDLYQRRRQLLADGASVIDEKAAWARAEDGRSALHLLCETGTVDAAEAVIMRVGHTAAESVNGQVHESETDDDAPALLRDLVRRLRVELGAGTG
jgi:hypothetical protein